MESYDALIVGAGPAGGECARRLAEAGKRVLLLEKAKDFSANNYSSGGAPLEILSAFQLPSELVSSKWNKFSLSSSYVSHQWASNEPKGVVLDFKKLRSFLAQEAVKRGSTLMLDCSYVSHEQQKGLTLVKVKCHHSKEPLYVHTRVLIDASGSERSVLQKNRYDKRSAIAATGLEYHIEVSSAQYHAYADTLSFFIGHAWMPQGYAWIFPLNDNLLKIGVVRYFLHENVIPHQLSLKNDLVHIIKRCFGTTSLRLHAKHGKTIYYSYGQKDLRTDKHVIGVGDAISTLNPLAAEGIRHAMASGAIAATHCLGFLDSNKTLEGYSKALDHYFGYKWLLSEKIMKSIYREKNDKKIDLILKTFKNFSFDDLLSLGFSYRVSKIVRFYARLNYLRFLERVNRPFAYVGFKV